MVVLEKEKLYPLKFEPVYKEVFWGGSKLRSALGRPLEDSAFPIGEAWDIADRGNVNSEVVNGPLTGTTLAELVAHFGCDFVGKNYSGGPFPVMVKIIDAAKRLSLHVHPGETYAAGGEVVCEPKTEMWFVLQAEKGAKIYAGLKTSSTRQQFLNQLSDPEVEDLLQSFDSIPGDAFFIPGGRVHSIGAGNLLLEVSQNSDTTYRISDWNRVDEHGEARPLDPRAAVAAMDFTDRAVSRICGASDAAGHNRKYPLINRCPFFRCEELMLVGNWRDNTNKTSSCHILTAVNTPFDVGDEHVSAHAERGESILIPACFEDYMIAVKPGAETDIIRTTL